MKKLIHDEQISRQSRPFKPREGGEPSHGYWIISRTWNGRWNVSVSRWMISRIPPCKSETASLVEPIGERDRVSADEELRPWINAQRATCESINLTKRRPPPLIASASYALKAEAICLICEEEPCHL